MTKTKNQKPGLEFTRPVDLGHLDDGEDRVETIAPTPEERAALARRFNLEALENLEARVRLMRRGTQVLAEATVAADVVQACVISLEPVPAQLRFTIAQLYDPDVRESGEFDDLLDVADDDPPEPLIDDTVDIGELVAERLGLELDPYPRKPGATVDPRYLAPEEDGEGDGANEERPHPFAALKRLKQ